MCDFSTTTREEEVSLDWQVVPWKDTFLIFEVNAAKEWGHR
jgi:hypothetical protein